LFAATGPTGKVFRIDPSGVSSIFYPSDEPHIVSLAVGNNGEVYAGSSGKGILYKITGPGRAEVLYDFPGEEVKGIAVGANNSVYAIGNDYGEPPDIPKRTGLSGHAPAGPSTSARPKPGKGMLVRFDAQGKPETLMKHSGFHYMSLALGDDGHRYVGTGAEGRSYTVDDAHAVTLVADTDERWVGAIAFAKGGGFACSSDGGVFHRIVSVGGPDAVWTSKPLDAGLRAKFGQLSWR